MSGGTDAREARPSPRARRSDRLDQRLATARLDDGDLHAVARAIAIFHAAAPRIDLAPDEALAALRAHVRPADGERREAAPEALGRAERVQLDFVDREAGRLAERVRGGRVREVHGELGLEHVYVDARGHVELVDRASPDDPMRRIDVCADVALLADELAAAGRADLAERFVAAYAVSADDFDLYPVIDFYASLRASLRARLELDRAAGTHRRTIAEWHAARAHRFLKLALAVARQPLLPPALIATGGQVASGKSTVADALARAIGAPVVNTDRTRSALLGAHGDVSPHEIHWERAYAPGFARRVYDEVLRRATEVLVSGRPVLVDGCFRSRAQRAAVRALAQRYGVPFYFVEVRVGEASQRERLRERARRDGEPDATWLDIAEALRRDWEPPDDLAASEHLVVDTDRPLAANLDALRAALPTWPERLTG
jgi:predicted kinase